MSLQLRQGSRGEEVRLIQAALNQVIGTKLVVDGDYGPGTIGAVKFLQRKHRLPETGVFTDAEYQYLEKVITEKLITPQDFMALAEASGIRPSMLMAIRDIESKGEGFLNDGRPVILFERHQFFKYLAQYEGRGRAEAVSRQYPNICWPKYVQGANGYYGGAREYDRLAIAKSIHPQAAFMSASWGLMQVMGFNHEAVGYDTVFEFVEDMMVSEKLQFKAGVAYLMRSPRVLQAARNLEYAVVAEYYNGSGYAAHGYHTRMAKARDRYAKYD